MVVQAANVAWIKARLEERVGAPYVYGGTLSPTNVRQGCDCSALAAHICNGVIRGSGMTWERIDQASGAWITTESWRPIRTGERGPFGTVTVARPADIPADAPVKLALHHGPGGGANSHMWCELDGVRYESAGGKGLVSGSRARAINDSYGNDWAYLPGPVTGSPGAPRPTHYTVQRGDTLALIAQRHGLEWRELAEWNRLPDPDRIAVGQVLLLRPRQWPTDYSDRELLVDIAMQLRGPTGEGWPQLGRDQLGRDLTLVDAVADMREALRSRDSG